MQLVLRVWAGPARLSEYARYRSPSKHDCGRRFARLAGTIAFGACEAPAPSRSRNRYRRSRNARTAGRRRGNSGGDLGCLGMVFVYRWRRASSSRAYRRREGGTNRTRLVGHPGRWSRSRFPSQGRRASEVPGCPWRESWYVGPQRESN